LFEGELEFGMRSEESCVYFVWVTMYLGKLNSKRMSVNTFKSRQVIYGLAQK
jgi:hypothetical protein